MTGWKKCDVWVTLQKMFISISSRIVYFSFSFGFSEMILVGFNSFNFVFFWRAGMSWNCFCIFLAGVTKICWRLHYFNEGKEFVPSLNKFCVSHNCVPSNLRCMFIASPLLFFGGGSRQKLDAMNSLVAWNSAWQGKAFSSSLIFNEAYNMLEGYVRSSVKWNAFFVAVDSRT